MVSLNIQVPVPVYALMTERLREELMDAEQTKLQNLESQLLMLAQFSQTERNQFERQQQLMAEHEACQSRANNIQDTVAGSKFLLRVVQGTVALKEGDNLLEALHPEVFIADGIVSKISCEIPGAVPSRH